MPSFEGVKQALTFDSILIAIAVILAIFGVIKGIVSGVEAWKKISLRDRVKKLEDDMKKVNERLDAGNRRFTSQSEDMGQILQTLSALQLHFISGNDHEKLKESNEQLVEYMNKRATRDAERV
jgi:biopolymer transport protein ExbB/TolQ